MTTQTMEATMTDTKAADRQARRDKAAAAKKAKAEAKAQADAQVEETAPGKTDSPVVAPKVKVARVSTKVPSPHLSKPCPKCGVAAGERCKSALPPDYSVDIVHTARKAEIGQEVAG